jgi:hypothetical protein
VKELSTLVHRDTFLPAINTAYFPNTNTMSTVVYWSSITAGSVDYARYVGFGYGVINDSPKYNGFYVRAVRGWQKSNNLVDNSDGTVTDTNTGLMWQQAEAGVMTWEEALAYCETFELAGHDDWRLPNINELQSIVEYEYNNPSIDTALFPGTNSGAYWSSTTYANTTGGAWTVNFDHGYVGGLDKFGGRNVRAVRAGQ